MEKMSIMEMKHEMDVLVHLNQVINDFVDMMGLRILTHIDPNYFTEVCRDFINMIDDSPYVTQYLKDKFSNYLMKKVHKSGPMSEQGQELKKFSMMIGDNISDLRESYLDALGQVEANQ